MHRNLIKLIIMSLASSILTPSLLVPVISSILTYFLFHAYRTRRTSSYDKQIKRPPSPPKLPFIGNLHQLGKLPHRSLAALAAKHGPLMLLQLGRVPLLVVSSPAMAREVMKTQDHLFANRPSLKAGERIFYGGKDVAFAPYGEYWKQVRKISVHHLLSPARVLSYRCRREEEVGVLIDKIYEASASRKLVNLSDMLQCFARDLISRIVLGECSRDEAWRERICRVISESSGLLGEFFVGDHLPSMAWLDRVSGLEAKTEKSFREGDEILDEMIGEKMEKFKRKGEEEEEDGDGEKSSFVDVLVSLAKDSNREFAFDQDNIKAIIKDMFGAATESTYITMDWVMAELIKNPNAMTKLRNELRPISNTRATISEQISSQLPYLSAVIKEALRLHPPGPLLVPRELMQTTQAAEFQIARGTRVVTNVWAICRDPEVWDSPEEFVPERFLGGSSLDFKGHDFEFTPFGAGRRICPGIQFASHVIELAVANLVHLFEWELPHGMKMEDMDMIETSGLTARRSVKLMLRATPRFT